MAPESRDEVRQRIDNLYDQAENATGNYNATRAMNGGSRSRGVPLFKRPRRDDPGLESIAREWFDTARSRLGPSVPAALPADRQPARPGPRRPVSAMAADLLGQVEGSGPSRPELTAGPSANSDIEVVREPAARPGRELTAGSPAALPPGSSDAPRALPAAAPRRATPGTSKTRSQLKIAKARELLSQRTGQRAVAALEPAAPAQAPQAAPVAQAPWTTTEARVPARRPAPAGAPGRYGDTGASPETAVTDTGGIPIVSPTDTGTFRIITPGSAPSRLPAAPPGFRVMTPGGTGEVPAAPAMDTAPAPTAALGDTGSFRVMTPGATGTFPMPDDTGAFPAATPAKTEAFPTVVPADTAAFQATAPADIGPFPTMAPADMNTFRTAAPADMGAFQTVAPTDMGAFQTMAPTDMGAFQTMAPTDMGAFQY
ncbi:hypothetical protein, partial [Streptomyces sp. NPDC093970]|uniref:hypothetical protein n=1 Tax=Streptomyces sp. NPDC093970 TaxID=3155076 RepID=UPI00342B0FE5